MKTQPGRITKYALLCVAMLTAWGTAAQDLDFLERFALAENREEVLTELVPGTRDYFFFHCLHYQNTGRLDEADTVLERCAQYATSLGQAMPVWTQTFTLAGRAYLRGDLEAAERLLRLRARWGKPVLEQIT